MPIQDLKSRIDRLPEQPGVYLFSNAAGETIYVGKARSLRDRVRSYLGAWGTSPKTDALLDEADGLEVILTDSVVEALALENNLIKQRMPKYNILLRDDKNYPYLQLTDQPRRSRACWWPGASSATATSTPARSCPRAWRAAPWRSATGCSASGRATRTINGRRDRPCLEYDIKRCLAPCVETRLHARSATRAAVDGRAAVPRGADRRTARRARSSGWPRRRPAERFEQAAQLRDATRTVQTLRDRQQKMATVELGDRDAFGIKTGPAGASIQVFQVRRGRVIERVDLVAELGSSRAFGHGQSTRPDDRGGGAAGGPPAVLRRPRGAARDPRAGGAAGGRARSRRGCRRAPAGACASSCRSGARSAGCWTSPPRNAAHGLPVAVQPAATPPTTTASTRCASVLGLPALPRRIECFDISTIQGSDTVASMVVCEDGRMKRSASTASSACGRRRPRRRAGWSSTTSRRCTRWCCGATAASLEAGGPFPDLILIDGGKGQLSAAYAALEELGLSNLVAVGLAKKEELVFTRDRDEPLALPGPSSRPAPAAADSRRGAPVRGHVPPPGAGGCATCGPNSTASPASGRAAAARC